MEKNEENEKTAFNIFIRIIRVDQLLSAGVYPNIEYLMKDEELGGVSRATVYRIIERMKYELNAPIIFDKEKNGYCYATKTFRLPAFFLTEKQMESVNFFEDYVENLKGNPVYENFKSVLKLLKQTAQKNPLDRPFDPFGDLTDYDSTEKVKLDFNVNDHIIVLEDSRNETEEATWNQIEKAIKFHHIISFDYAWPTSASLHHNPMNVSKVAPYQIICSGKKWYLWGWNYTKEAFQLFDMNKIFGVEIDYQHIKFPEKYDYRECGSGNLMLDMHGAKIFRHKFVLKTEKHALELKKEWKTNYVLFSDNEDGTVNAEVTCSTVSAEKICSAIKEAFGKDAVVAEIPLGK